MKRYKVLGRYRTYLSINPLFSLNDGSAERAHVIACMYVPDVWIYPLK